MPGDLGGILGGTPRQRRASPDFLRATAQEPARLLPAPVKAPAPRAWGALTGLARRFMKCHSSLLLLGSEYRAAPTLLPSLLHNWLFVGDLGAVQVEGVKVLEQADIIVGHSSLLLCEETRPVGLHMSPQVNASGML
jgi:hypothetical protein